ncbi:MAG: HDOD domain-containing protein, partial [Thiotrichaceae bacterium]|nr:HDOD domain-containing protein [Thiotrichaceae bacterium]
MDQNSNPSIGQLLKQVNELISQPEVYLKISHLMDDKWSTVGDFAEVIKYDPNLSATVLRVVNSAFYGFSGQIDSIAR